MVQTLHQFTQASVLVTGQAVLSGLTARPVSVTFAKADLLEYTEITACTNGPVQRPYQSAGQA